MEVRNLCNRFVFLLVILSGCKASETSSTAVVSAVSVPCTLGAASSPRVQMECTPVKILNGNGNGNSPLVLTLIATVTPPVVDTVALQATDVVLNQTNAFLSYNVAGETIKGAMDIIDFSNPALPKNTSELDFSDTKINSIFSRDNSLYYVGAKLNLGALVGKVGVTGNTFSKTLPVTANLKSYAGTSIYVSSANVYATSGDTGGLTVLDKTLNQLFYVTLNDARAVSLALDESQVSVFTGQPGALNDFSPLSPWTAGPVYSLGGAGIAQSKSTILVGTTSTLASLGDGGLTIICSATGDVLASVPAVTVQGLDSTKTVTNAASATTGYVFAANGEAGIYVYSDKRGGVIPHTSCRKSTLTLVGSLDLGAGISANHVYYKNGYLFVASGLGGFKIIQVTLTPGSDDNEDFSNN